MSTPEGHSALQPLQARQRSSAAAVASTLSLSKEDRPWTMEGPLSAVHGPRINARNKFALPRVECISSRVAWYEGHITPVSFLHTPCPLHCSIAMSIPSLRAKERFVSQSCVR